MVARNQQGRHIGGSLFASTPFDLKAGSCAVRPLPAEDTHALVDAAGQELARHPNGYSCQNLGERLAKRVEARAQADYIIACGGAVTEAGWKAVTESEGTVPVSFSGAPMGRPEQPTHDDGDMADLTRQSLGLFRVRPVDGGDYDDGGAYWGGLRSRPLYCCRADGVELFVRASDRTDAKAKIRARFPSLTLRFRK